MRLVFANQTEEDILLRPELDAFAEVEPSSVFEPTFRLNMSRLSFFFGKWGLTAGTLRIWKIRKSNPTRKRF